MTLLSLCLRLPASALTRRAATRRCSLLRAARPGAWSRPRAVTISAAGGWRISDDLGSGSSGGERRGESRRRSDAPPPTRRASEYDRDEYDADPRAERRGRDAARRVGRGGRGGRAGRADRADRDHDRRPLWDRDARDDRGRPSREAARRDQNRGDRRGRAGGRGGRSGRAPARDARDERRDARRDRPTNRESPPSSRDASDYDPATRNDTGQNDWRCAACGADNFARRVACFRCGAERGSRRGVEPRLGPDARGGRRVVHQSRRAPRGDAPRDTSYSTSSYPSSLAEGTCRYYATCHPGLERVVADELSSPLVGASDVAVGSSGVSFVGSPRVGYLANVWLRSAIRVLVEMRRGWLDPAVPGGESVYEFVRDAAPWSEVVPMSDGSTFSVESRVWSCAGLTSTRLASTRAKDAVCDALVDANGWRPPPPRDGHASADVPMFLSLYRDEAVLYRDMSGDSLHRRGYRDAAVHRAALNESAAAGLLSIAGWSSACEASRAAGGAGYRLPTLVDPMCGSGTILVEAALMAGHVAPGLVRTDAASARGDGSSTAYAFERWPDHDPGLLEEILEQAADLGADARRNGERPTLVGNDIHAGALSLAKRAARAAGVENLIHFTHGDCADLHHPALAEARSRDADAAFEIPSDLDELGPVTLRPGGGGVLVVSNPPWGKRVGGAENEARAFEDDAFEDDETGRDGGGAGDGDWSHLDEGEGEGEGEGSGGGPGFGSGSGSDAAGSAEHAWSALGGFFRRECGGATAHLLSGDAGVTRPLRMRARRKRVLGIGGVDCRLLEYRILPPRRDGPTLRELVEEARE